MAEENEQQSVQITLNLTKVEMNQFFWIAFGASLVPYKNAPGAGPAYKQIIEQIEKYWVDKDPKCRETIDFVKERLREAHQANLN